jgi:hypothetical protein
MIERKSDSDFFEAGGTAEAQADGHSKFGQA